MCRCSHHGDLLSMMVTKRWLPNGNHLYNYTYTDFYFKILYFPYTTKSEIEVISWSQVSLPNTGRNQPLFPPPPTKKKTNKKTIDLKDHRPVALTSNLFMYGESGMSSAAGWAWRQAWPTLGCLQSKERHWWCKSHGGWRWTPACPLDHMQTLCTKRLNSASACWESSSLLTSAKTF